MKVTPRFKCNILQKATMIINNEKINIKKTYKQIAKQLENSYVDVLNSYGILGN